MKNSSGCSSSTYLNFNSGNFCNETRRFYNRAVHAEAKVAAVPRGGLRALGLSQLRSHRTPESTAVPAGRAPPAPRHPRGAAACKVGPAWDPTARRVAARVGLGSRVNTLERGTFPHNP